MRWENEPFSEPRRTIGDSGLIDGPLDADDENGSGGSEPAWELPEGTSVVVYVPSERVEGTVRPDTKVQLRYLEDGQLALPVFASLDQLIADCGDGQPWIAIPAEHVDLFRQIVGADLAVLDPVLPAEQVSTRRTEG